MPQGPPPQSQPHSHSLPLMNNLGNINMNGAESMYSPSAVSHASTTGPNSTAMNNFQAMFNLTQGVSLQQQLNNSLPMNPSHLQQSQQQLLSQIASSNVATPAAALVLSEPSDSNDGGSKAKRRVPSKKDDSKSDKSTSKVKSSSSGSNKDKESAPNKASSSSASRSSKDREKRSSESGKERDSPKKPSSSSKFSSGSAPYKSKSKKEGNKKIELPAASEMDSRQTSASSTDSKTKNDSSSNSIQHTPIIAVPEGTLGLTNTIDENSLHHSIVVKDSRVQSLRSPSLDHHEYDDGLGGASSYHHPHLTIRPYGSDFGSDYQHPSSPSIGMMQPTSHIMDEHGFSSELHGMSGAGSPMPISPAAAEPRVGRLDLHRHHDDDAMDYDGDDADRQDGDEDDNEDDNNNVKSPQNGSTSEEERLVASGGKLSRSFSTSHSHDSDLATSHSSLSTVANGLNESRKRSSTAIHDDGMTDDWLSKRIHLSMN